MTAGLPLFYQWCGNGLPVTNGGIIAGAQTPDIGHPKLFMAGKASAAFSGSLPAVNNFVAAGAATAGLDGVGPSFVVSGLRFPAPAGQVC